MVQFGGVVVEFVVDVDLFVGGRVVLVVFGGCCIGGGFYVR